MTRERNLDLLRGIGAVAVVLLHAPPLYHSNVAILKAMGWGIREVCQIAVPLFFLISGYLAGKRYPEPPGGTRTLKRILFLYLPWFWFYLVLDVLKADKNVDVWVVLRRLLGVSVENAPTSGYHLWFLPAMLWGFLALRGVVALFKSVVPALVGGALIYIGVGWASFPNVDLPWQMVPHEGISISLACLALGYLYGEKVAKGGRMARPPSPWILLAAFGWLFVEGVALGFMGKQPWLIPAFQSGRIVLPMVLLWLAVTSGTWTLPGRLDSWADKLALASTGIYVMHLAVLELVPFDALVGNGFIRDNFVRWPVAIVISLALTLLMIRRGPKSLRHLVQ